MQPAISTPGSVCPTPQALRISPPHAQFALTGLLFALAFAGCTEKEEPVAPPLGVRPVRVLLFDSTEGCEVCVDGAFSLDTPERDTLASGDALQCTLVTSDGGVRIGNLEQVQGPVKLTVDAYAGIKIRRFEDGKKQTARTYPGSISFSIRDNGSLRVVNEVDIESYIGGVVACEASSAFGEESLKGQAIAARTFAMYIMAQRAKRSYDLRASEGAQVYRGHAPGRFGRRSRAAAEATRGLVLSHASRSGQRIFCAYFSSACGGRSQSLSDVQQSDPPEPLRGGVKCDYCKIAKKNVYRWGPSEISKKKLLQRLQSRRGDFDDWSEIDIVRVVKKTKYGRVRTVALANKKGDEIKLGPEHFRLAVGSRTMRSTDCTVHDDGDTVRMTDGRGFGHGLGLCQWGMEGLAREGKSAGEILRFYYPGSKLVRAY